VSDPYCYPGTEVLRNHFGITDGVELAIVEFKRTLARLLELNERPVVGSYDLMHPQAFHRHLFQDVYPWAGELRTVDIAKDGTYFARSEYIRGSAADIFEVLAARRHLRGLGKGEFVMGAANLLGDLNALHPFRDGNGRAQRAFLSQLAGEAGWNVDWRHVSPSQNIAASIASGAGDHEPFVEILSRAVTARPQRKAEA
jgi:cell filamentation protein